jgi:hypothetical protein
LIKAALLEAHVMRAKYLILMFAGFISCEKNTDKSLSVTFNFYSDTQGWSGDFADYPAGQEEFYELNAGWERLPAPLDTLRCLQDFRE